MAGTTGVEVGAATIRNTLAELGFRWGRPKLDLAHRQDPADVARAKRLRNGALKKRSSAAAAGPSCISTKPNST
ncbi:MAG: hypothetical protein H5T92_05070 [Synergistales bacterium]|nr:hypothetical protein [Synergistales bacterium]